LARLVRIYLTGRVAIEGTSLVDEGRLPGPLGRVLLAVLSLSRGPVSRSRVAEAAGGDRGLFVSGSGAIELRRSPGVWIDVDQATTALDAAEGALRRGDPGRAWPRAAVATSILGRPFLEGVDLRWVNEQRRSLHDRRARAYEVAAEVWIRLGDAGQAVVAARRLVEADPFRETSYERLIRAHLLAGNRAEALLVFAECEKVLRDELGVGPSPLVQSAYEDALGIPG
jgi:hypothetical protein